MADLIPVPEEHHKAAAGRIFRNNLTDPIGGLDEHGVLVVYDDWRWQRFLASRTATQPSEVRP